MIETIIIKEEYMYDSISARNDDAWKLIYSHIINNVPTVSIEDGKEVLTDLTLDFDGIMLTAPWLNNVFCSALKSISQNYGKVNIIIHGDSEVANGIRMACIIEGFTDINVMDEIECIEEINTNDIREDLVATFEENLLVEGNLLTVGAAQAVTSLGMDITIKAMGVAIERLLEKCSDKNITDISFDLNLIVNKNRIKTLCELIVGLEQKGYNVTILSDEEELIEKLNTYKILVENIENTDDKAQLIRGMIPKNTAGTLARYEQTIRRDEFGRSGDGKILWRRVAIFKGINKEGKAVFKAFPKSGFCTAQERELSEEATKYTAIKEEISLEEIGVSTKDKAIMGTFYHFELPIQQKEEQSIDMWCYNSESKKAEYRNLLFPEYMQIVFDDNNEEYNKEMLEQSIKDTKEILGNNAC